MNIPRKYLTIYVVLGSILIFSLKDSLGLIHTVLHAIPNPYHHHSYLPHTHLEGDHGHDEQAPHTHQVQHPTTGHQHDLMDHVAYGHKKDQASQSDKEEIKTIAELTWDIQALFSFQLCKPYQLRIVSTFFTIARTQLTTYHPPSPPPKFS